MKSQINLFAIFALLLGLAFSVKASNNVNSEPTDNCEEEIAMDASDCLIVPFGIEALDIGPNSSSVTFRASVSKNRTTTLGSTAFELNFRSGRKEYLSGHLQTGGYLQAITSISCADPVVYVIFRVNGISTSGNTCANSTAKSFFGGLCPNGGTLFNGNPDIGEGTGLGE